MTIDPIKMVEAGTKSTTSSTKNSLLHVDIIVKGEWDFLLVAIRSCLIDNNLFFHIGKTKAAKATDGRNILYAVNCNVKEGVAVDQGATQRRAAVLAAKPSGRRVPQPTRPVKSVNNTEPTSSPDIR